MNMVKNRIPPSPQQNNPGQDASAVTIVQNRESALFDLEQGLGERKTEGFEDPIAGITRN